MGHLCFVCSHLNPENLNFEGSRSSLFGGEVTEGTVKIRNKAK